MTREYIEEYRSKKEEIKELEYKLKHLGEESSLLGNDTINDYRTGYPIPQPVIGVDWNKYINTKGRYEKRLQKLKAECELIEEYIEEIEDSMTRRIFRLYFIDGVSQEKVARAVHLSQSAISKKFMKN